MRNTPLVLTLLLCLLFAPGTALLAQDFGPVTDRDYRDRGRPDEALVELGRFLFFDKILSGNKNISCATCHHPLAFTSDGLSLPVGEGGNGIGVTRDTGHGQGRIHERVPRNSPAIFNEGAREFRTLFHDGRLRESKSEPSGYISPAGDALPEGLVGLLAAQAMFPITSGAEMAGQQGENKIGNAASHGRLDGGDGVWNLLAMRLREIPGYVDLFKAAFKDVKRPHDITMVHAANAIGAFEEAAWRSDNSPFDRYLRGEKGAMSNSAKAGMRLFYGRAGCANCHTGPFQTDHKFHATAMPQIGPGKGDGPDGLDDFGRERETGKPADRFRFRTPSLRNIELTAPYGHAGAYNTLEAVVRHMFDPVSGLRNYDRSQAVLPSRSDLDALDFVVMDDPDRVTAIANANQMPPVSFSKRDVQEMVDFLRSLTDPAMIDLRDDVPLTVPSGLPVVERLPQ